MNSWEIVPAKVEVAVLPLPFGGLVGEAALVLRGAGRVLPWGARLVRAGFLGLVAARHTDGVAGGGHFRDVEICDGDGGDASDGEKVWSANKTGAMMRAAARGCRVEERLASELSEASGIQTPGWTE